MRRSARERSLRVDHARRRFLRQSAVASAALMLGACARVPMPLRATGTDEVVVVGAGVAGLTCAHRLRQAGVPEEGIPGAKLAQARQLYQRLVVGGQHPADLVGER